METALEKQKSELEKTVQEFLEYLEVERSVSPLTVRNYAHYLRRFTSWMLDHAKLKLTDVDSDAVRQFRLHLSRLQDKFGSPLSKKTQGYHAIALRSFLRWLVKNDRQVLSPDKIELPKMDDRSLKFLNGEQVDRLLNSPSLSSINGKRDKAILEVLFSTGLRVSELVSLDRDKVDLERREFGVIGKGGKARVVFLSGRAAEWVQGYLDSRSDNYLPLFIRHKGKFGPGVADEETRLTARSVQRMIKKYARKVNIPVDVTPHVMRHSFATDLLMAGADLRSVQEMLGHKNVSTTQIYTHVTNRQLRDVHDAFHGKGGK
ncbi:MAG: Tyrosine recombinase XerD [Microgenomates group bacterium GW2011_GWA2_39_19]|nr:MAG: Tyrosine recombinase XerD [Microgenomates group bacterium GW2011_GWA2_39_19]